MLRVFTCGLGLWAMACGNQSPCTSCPTIDGPYLVSWQNGIAQPGCPAAGPRPVNFNLTQEDSRITSAVGGEVLRGTLYDTYDFSIFGGRAETTYSLRGRAVIDRASDGGTPRVQLLGTLSTRTGAATSGCELRENYTADRL